MDPYFVGKTVLVTGAGAGIGHDLVKKLAQLGAYVIAVSKTQANLDSLKTELGGKIETVCVDLSDWNETESKLAKLCQQVDLLVNNAGYGFTSPVDAVTEVELDKVLDINLKAPMNLIKLVAPGMRQRKFGSIVNVSSVAAIAGLDEHVAYAASKGGLDMVTKVSAKELGPFNVRVNSVNPTVVWTKMGRDHWQEGTRKATMTAKIPMGRFVEVHEVVDPIVFLLSEKSSMINGIMMPIDGGFVST